MQRVYIRWQRWCCHRNVLVRRNNEGKHLSGFHLFLLSADLDQFALALGDPKDVGLNQPLSKAES